MRCDEFLSMIDDYLDGAFADEDSRVQFLLHAEQCDSCRNILLLAETIHDAMLGMDDDVPVPLPAQAAWRKAVRSEGMKRRTLRTFRRSACGIAAALVLLVGGTFAMRDTISTNAVNETVAVGVHSLDSGAASYAPENNPRRMKMAAVIQADGAEEEDQVYTTAEETEDLCVTDTQSERILVRCATREIETIAFDDAYSRISDLLEEYDGYFRSSSIEKDDRGRIARMTASVASEDADAFLSAIAHTGSVIWQEDLSNDITQSYFDAEDRFTSLTAEKNRLNELIANATNADEIADLKAQLEDVYFSLDAVQSRIADYRGQLQDSTIDIILYEGSARASRFSDTTSVGLGSRISDAFASSASFFADMLVCLAVIAPYAIAVLLLAAATTLIIVLIRRQRK